MNEMRWGIPTTRNNQSECTRRPIKKIAMFFRNTRDENTFELGFNDFLITFSRSTVHVAENYVMCTVSNGENNRQCIDAVRSSVTIFVKDKCGEVAVFFSLLLLPFLLDFECIDR